MFFDDIHVLRTINDAPNPHIIKIFFYLAFHQPDSGIHGFQIEKSQLQANLKLGRTIFLDSLRWLYENGVVNELKLVGMSDFMVNPYHAMNNGDKDARIKEWSRRLKLYDDNIKKNQARRRREALRKQNK